MRRAGRGSLMVRALWLVLAVVVVVVLWGVLVGDP